MLVMMLVDMGISLGPDPFCSCVRSQQMIIQHGQLRLRVGFQRWIDRRNIIVNMVDFRLALHPGDQRLANGVAGGKHNPANITPVIKKTHDFKRCKFRDETGKKRMPQTQRMGRQQTDKVKRKGMQALADRKPAPGDENKFRRLANGHTGLNRFPEWGAFENITLAGLHAIHRGVIQKRRSVVELL
ncbi:MAG: Uncharacterised protein [SAR116 cluster bacterium MED-G04]|nr:MAG: Uncharacterised protein [SAR116 cluster bacterium MED-G04]